MKIKEVLEKYDVKQEKKDVVDFLLNGYILKDKKTHEIIGVIDPSDLLMSNTPDTEVSIKPYLL